MANSPTTAFGLKPVRTVSGADWSGKVRSYYASASYATAMYIGDPVVLYGQGNQNAVDAIGGSFVPGSLAEVRLATAGASNKIAGVITSVMAVSRDSVIYREASVERILHVVDVRDVIFQIRGDGGGALAYTTVSLNAVLISGTGSAVTGLSGWALDEGTTTAPAADATYQLDILNVANFVGNEVASKYAVWEVLINQHSFAPATAGV